MNKREPDLIRPTTEDEAEIAAHLAEDPDTYEWTEEDWGNAQTIQELFPEVHVGAVRRGMPLMQTFGAGGNPGPGWPNQPE